MTDTYGIQINSDAGSSQITTEHAGFVKWDSGTVDLPQGSGWPDEFYQSFEFNKPIPSVTPVIVSHKIFTYWSTLATVWLGSWTGAYMFKSAGTNPSPMDWQVGRLSPIMSSTTDEYGINIYNDEKRNLVNITESLSPLRLIRSTQFVAGIDGGPAEQFAYAEDAYNHFFTLTPTTWLIYTVQLGFVWYIITAATMLDVRNTHSIAVIYDNISVYPGGSSPARVIYAAGNLGPLNLLEFEPLQ